MNNSHGEDTVLLQQQNKHIMFNSSQIGRPRTNTSPPSFIKPTKPKGSSLKKRLMSLVWFAVHLPSITITVFILTLSFTHIFWSSPSDSTNTILASLQFAAQLHASLIALSLSSILLHYIHRSLQSPKGAPLGFLSSNFQLHSISYLFSSELKGLAWRYIGVWVILFSIGLLAGPSSAIAMLPRLQFWDINNFWIAKGHVDFHIFMEVNETSLYPIVLTSANVLASCTDFNASLLTECPSSAIKFWMQHDEIFSSGTAYAVSVNTSMEEIPRVGASWQRLMVGSTTGHYGTNTGMYESSVLAKFLGGSILAWEGCVKRFYGYGNYGFNGYGTLQSVPDGGLLARYELGLRAGAKKVEVKKPLTEVQCQGYSHDTTSIKLPHALMAWPPWTFDPIKSSIWTIDTTGYLSLASDLNSTIVNTTFIDVTQFGAVAPSLAAIFSTPSIYTNEVRTTNLSWYACTVDSRWLPTSLIYDASTGTPTVFDGNPNPLDASQTAAADVGLYPSSPNSISISPSFASVLNAPFIDSVLSPSSGTQSILSAIGQKCLNINTYINSTTGLRTMTSGESSQMSSCLASVLSLYITDAISRLQDSIPAYFVAEGHIVPDYDDGLYPSDMFLVQDLYSSERATTGAYPLANGTIAHGFNQVSGISREDLKDEGRFMEVVVQARRWGYGWGFEGSRLIYVGVVVLLAHVTLCFGYLGWVLVVGNEEKEAWGSIGELVVFGMRSGAANSTAEASEEVGEGWSDRYVIEDLGENYAAGARRRVMLRKISTKDRDEEQVD